MPKSEPPHHSGPRIFYLVGKLPGEVAEDLWRSTFTGYILKIFDVFKLGV